MELKEKVKNLPSSPGVYFMKDSQGTIIYVGKSKNLKSRVSSYFQNSNTRTSKTEKLVMNIKDFEYILTDTEFEALLLECKLIKALKPSYNRKMKNPLSYVYIKININEAYPSIIVTNVLNKGDSCLYLGPYTSKGTVERAIQGIKETYKIMCSNPSQSKNACLNYSLGLCIGICLGKSSEVYRSIIDKIIALFNRTDESILEEMEKNMLTAAERFDFETAAKYRDYIASINALIGTAKVKDFTEQNKNFIVMEHLDESELKYFLINGNKVLASDKIDLNIIDKIKLKDDLNMKILECFTSSNMENSQEVDRDDIDESHIIYSYLKSSNCRYVIILNVWIAEKNSVEINTALDNLLC
ncbi:GIY-YIG nuclease family protein [Clostridium swellfunianum]|uniref:GIY-YIG nuclease family protein n=1 Tax=Clostridium swellfunianum TaxID=1367462 RepID=UPI0032D59918